jgi:hypothetical protein
MTTDKPPRLLTFTGKMTALHFAPHIVIRIAPTLHSVGTLPRIPHLGTVVQIETPKGPVRIRILSSDRACLVVKLDEEQWIMTPLKPTETQGVASFSEGSGATDWVVRTEG